MDELAILGGKPAIDEPLPLYQSVGPDEVEAVKQVAESGCLSGFYGSWGDEFFGGPQIQMLEQEWSQAFQVKHSVTVNSATSGLFAAIGAVGVSPGDEVIVPPTTMSATAMAPLIYGGIPVFVDIEPDTFCLDPVKVEAAITEKTKAIIVVNLFGHPAPLAQLRELADRHGIALIEDNAQGPMASEHNRLAGTVGHIGVFSLNYHKHIHAGEGGVCITDSEELHRRLSLIRNHGENVVGPLEINDIANMVGFNYRMTELSAAVARVQLARIDEHVESRIKLAEQLTNAVSGVPGIVAPQIRSGCKHVYYVWALRFDARQFGCSRELFSEALAAEGVPHGVGYVKPLYQLPMFQKRIAFGREGYPFTLTDRRYDNVECSVAESLHKNELVIFEPCQFQCDEKTINRFAAGLEKVCRNRESLAKLGKQAAA